MNNHRSLMRRLLTGLLALCLSVPVLAAGGDIQGHSKWAGQYDYPDGRASVPFSLELNVSRDGHLKGHSKEPATFGNGSSPFLIADLHGNVDGDRIEFIKSYNGEGGATHSVRYQGTLSDGGQRIKGEWNIDNYRGSFQAMRD
jgi:hypothetical protein